MSKDVLVMRNNPFKKSVLVVKAYTYDAFGNQVFVPGVDKQGNLVTGAPVRGERLAGIAGGTIGALTGLAGKHRSLGSLANAMMFGAQQGRSAGQRLRRFASTEGERARAQRRQDIDREYEKLVATGQIAPPRGRFGRRKFQTRGSKLEQINAPTALPRVRVQRPTPQGMGPGPTLPPNPILYGQKKPFGAGPPPRVPVSHRIPSEADVVPVTHQLAAPRPNVEVLQEGDGFEIIDEEPEDSVSAANRALDPARSVAIEDRKPVSTYKDGEEIAIADPNQVGFSQELPGGSLSEFGIPIGQRKTRTVGHDPTTSAFVEPPAMRTDLTSGYKPPAMAYGGGTKTQRDLRDNEYSVRISPGRDTRIDTTVPWDTSKDGDYALQEGVEQLQWQGRTTREEVAQREEQMANDAHQFMARQNQAEMFSSPAAMASTQPTMHGEGAENNADKILGQQVIGQIGLDDDPDLAGTNPADGVTPMPPAGGAPAGGAPTGPTVEEAGNAQAEKLRQAFNKLGVGNQGAQEPDEDMVAASIDRLPVVGIRKARTRRVLIV